MTAPDNFPEKSYQQHSEQFEECATGGEKEAHAKAWLETDTVDAWRHLRMYRALDPLLVADPGAKWLTVGDGRYGRDARYLVDKAADALASDIAETLLKEAKEAGYIPAYQQENAEALSFADSAFDYVMCKESYHHFPRPALALYEMLRVAVNAVVLIEPNDAFINNGFTQVFFRNLKSLAKRLLRGQKLRRYDFEETGNFIFTISRREMEKAALGLGYRTVAFLGINDAYLPGVEQEKLSEKGPLQKKARLLIRTADFFCRLGLMDYGLLAAVIFKQDPSPAIRQHMAVAGYRIVDLPENPYISG